MTIEEENKQASEWLLNYSNKLEIYKTLKEQFKVIGAMEYSGMPGGSAVGNPTLNKATTILEMEDYKKWLMAVEAAERTLSEKSLRFLYFRRLAEKMNLGTKENGRPGWTGLVAIRYAEWHHERWGGDYVPGQQTMKGWWRKIVDTTVRAAIRTGAIK